MIKYIIHIQEDTGQIVSVSYPQAETPSEGVSGEMRIVHLSENNIPANFKEPKFFITNFWWDNGFVEVGKKPNQYATWDTSSSKWVWDSLLLIEDARKVRNNKLRATDWTQLPDSPLSEIEKTIWQEYRQELRDITNNIDDITNLDDVPWPTKPE